MESERLREVVDQIFANGPQRVMIDEHEARPAKRAAVFHRITPEIIFIREDGWTLGAPLRLAAAAERLWADQWVAVMFNPPSIKTTPYKQWISEGRQQNGGNG